MVLLSISGFVRTVLIIVGVFVLLRLIGKMMIAKRTMDDHNQVQRKQNASDEMVRNAKETFGKTTISKIGKSDKNDGDFIDFEEVKED
ncbi:MAG: hypothetical protein ACI8ZM_005184 [Crocinitomix sp.]|jgi:hypothetical protein